MCMPLIIIPATPPSLPLLSYARRLLSRWLHTLLPPFPSPKPLHYFFCRQRNVEKGFCNVESLSSRKPKADAIVIKCRNWRQRPTIKTICRPYWKMHFSLSLTSDFLLQWHKVDLRSPRERYCYQVFDFASVNEIWLCVSEIIKLFTHLPSPLLSVPLVTVRDTDRVIKMITFIFYNSFHCVSDHKE